MSLFCQLGFEGALSFFGEWVVPSHSVYMEFSHSEEPAKKNMQSFMECVICCAQNICNLELSLIVEEMFQNAFLIAL